MAFFTVFWEGKSWFFDRPFSYTIYTLKWALLCFILGDKSATVIYKKMPLKK